MLSDAEDFDLEISATEVVPSFANTIHDRNENADVKAEFAIAFPLGK